jgi:hypothetical protein
VKKFLAQGTNMAPADAEKTGRPKKNLAPAK